MFIQMLAILWSCSSPTEKLSHIDLPTEVPPNEPTIERGGEALAEFERHGRRDVESHDWQSPILRATAGDRQKQWRRVICSANFAAIAQVIDLRSQDNLDGQMPMRPPIYTEVDLEIISQAVDGSAAAPDDVITLRWFGGSLEDGRQLSRRGNLQGPIPRLGSTIIALAHISGERQQILGSKAVSVDEDSGTYSYRDVTGSTSEWANAFVEFCSAGGAL